MVSNGLARQNLVVGVSTALTAISGEMELIASEGVGDTRANHGRFVVVIIVSLRTYTRSVILRNMGKDDYAMLAALTFTLGYLIAIFVLRENGMGFHAKEVTFDEATTSLKATYAIEILYYFCVNTIKISIVFFYLRIGTKQRCLAIKRVY
jgi:hypothetical protein